MALDMGRYAPPISCAPKHRCYYISRTEKSHSSACNSLECLRFLFHVPYSVFGDVWKSDFEELFKFQLLHFVLIIVEIIEGRPKESKCE
jgi:hypothetical protein